ncbi:MAG TPA: hypothetical protein VEZ42_13955, partial [Pseudonocardia sp.]|nr:hypothetical protein [Pseudonocardia sp.]
VEISGDTTVRTLGDAWLSEIDRAILLGKRSPTTAQAYRYRFERHVRDGIGELRVRELTVSRLDRLVIQGARQVRRGRREDDPDGAQRHDRSRCAA